MVKDFKLHDSPQPDPPPIFPPTPPPPDEDEGDTGN